MPRYCTAAPTTHKPDQPANQPTCSSFFLALLQELGRGAYGQVYKGLDLTNGDTVAVKQISLVGGISPDGLHGVMGEIELLKSLDHKNIVKYIGSFKTRTHLYIILEYMDNGSLASIIKPNKFGVFPEALVAVYIAQVLAGLQYLHEQGVVHRDIKGANILTTKEVSACRHAEWVHARVTHACALPRIMHGLLTGSEGWQGGRGMDVSCHTERSTIIHSSMNE